MSLADTAAQDTGGHVLSQASDGASHGAIVVPLGGLGSGQVGIAADGSLRQWQIHNQQNHRADVPETGFALRVASIEPPRSVRRVLRARPDASLPVRPAPLVTDHEPGAWPAMPTGWEPVERTTIAVRYPFVDLGYRDPALGVDVRLEAHTPFVPPDATASGLPLVRYRFTICELLGQHQHGWLVSALLNTVGWDGVTPIRGSSCSLLGGNTNRVVRRGRVTAISMDNPSLHEDDAASGSLCLWTESPAHVLPRAVAMSDALRWTDSLKLLGPTIDGRWDDASLRRAIADMAPTMRDPVGPSPAGRSWVGAMACAFALEPDGTTEVEVVHGWWLPNRMADFDQFGPSLPRPERHRLGNAYATDHASALDVVGWWRARRDELEATSRAWAVAWQPPAAGSGLDPVVLETLAAQPALVRSPSMFVAADGTLFGFEGTLGASTLNWNGDVGGSCPLSCTHVWNYEQAVASLFPGLERTMRAVEWDHALAPDGSLPHRVRVPLHGPQLHGMPIGGPMEPAIDGMLGAVLKTWREARATGDRAWLAGYWDRMVRLMGHVRERWDDGTGVLRGRQPVTFDIDLTGANMFVGGLWLAATRAMAAAGAELGDHERAAGFAELSAQAADAYDHALWNGEYYAQDETGADHDFGQGCLSDQLLGQWWAHLLGLGHVLPVERVRTTLRSIVRHNLRRDHTGVRHASRVFAEGSEGGLVVCSWPRGGRPRVPVRYADEVWSGTEYQVAAHCLMEGLEDEGLLVLRTARARADGARRNPWNEVECGDHYARAMSGWSLLPAATGVSWDGFRGALRLGGDLDRYPVVVGGAWGEATRHGSTLRLEVRHGSLPVVALEVRSAGVVQAFRRAQVGEAPVSLGPATRLVADLASGAWLVEASGPS